MELRLGVIRVRWERTADRLDPKRTGLQLVRAAELLDELAQLWAEGLEGGVYAPGRETGGRGTGFTDSDPTANAVLSGTQRQLRDRTGDASALIQDALERLEAARAALADGFLMTDEETLGRFLEKRAAATQAHARAGVRELHG